MLRFRRTRSCAQWTLALLPLVFVLWPGRMEAQAIAGGAARTRPGLPLGRPTNLFVVDDTPSPCRFSASIQAAVDAAGEGDVILVKPGFHHSQTTIDGKSLSVIGEGRPDAFFAVRNLRADQAVVLRGFQRMNGSRFTNNAGPVWVEDCSWLGAYDDGAGDEISATSEIGFFRCQPTGLSATNSSVIAYHSSFLGTVGRNADSNCNYPCDNTDGERGGPGLSVRRTPGERAPAFLFGCTVRGGRGGDEYFPGYYDCGFCEYCVGFCGVLGPGCGGNGLVLHSVTATLLQTQLIGGLRGYSHSSLPPCTGLPVSGGSPDPLSGQTGEFNVGSPVSVGSPLLYSFKGPPGQRAFVTWATEYTPAFDPSFRGVSVVPLASPTVFVGELPASGLLDVVVPAGNLLELGSEARVFYMQAKFYDPDTGIGVLGTPSALVVVRDPCP